MTSLPDSRAERKCVERIAPMSVVPSGPREGIDRSELACYEGFIPEGLPISFARKPVPHVTLDTVGVGRTGGAPGASTAV
jgi:hypothetical protein